MGNSTENLNLGKLLPAPLSLNLLHLFVALPKVAHFPKEIRQKSLPHEMRAIICMKSRR